MSEEELQKVPKKKCTKCEGIVSPQGTWTHVQNNHPELKDKYEEIKSDLFEDIEIEEVPPSPPGGEEEESVVDTVKSILDSDAGIKKDVKSEVIDWLTWSDLPTWDNATPQFVQWLLSSLTGQLKNFGVGDKPTLRVVSKVRNAAQRKMMEKQRIQQMIDMPLYHDWQGGSPMPPTGFPQSSQAQDPWQMSQLQNPWQTPQSQNLQQTPQPPAREKPYTVVIEGEPVKTYDPMEYKELMRYKKEEEEREEERERRKEKHDREMKELDARIKKATESTPSGEENTVPIPIDEEGNITIDVPERDALLWQVVKNQQPAKEEEEKIPITIEGQEVEVPPTIAALIESRRAERSDRVKKLEDLVRNQQKQIEALRSEGSKTGKTAIDIADGKLPGSNEIQEMAQEFFKRFPPQPQLPQTSEEPEYEPEKTPGEREETKKDIERKLDKTEEEIETENEFINAARGVYT